MRGIFIEPNGTIWVAAETKVVITNLNGDNLGEFPTDVFPAATMAENIVVTNDRIYVTDLRSGFMIFNRNFRPLSLITRAGTVCALSSFYLLGTVKRSSWDFHWN